MRLAIAQNGLNTLFPWPGSRKLRTVLNKIQLTCYSDFILQLKVILQGFMLTSKPAA